MRNKNLNIFQIISRIIFSNKTLVTYFYLYQNIVKVILRIIFANKTLATYLHLYKIFLLILRIIFPNKTLLTYFYFGEIFAVANKNIALSIDRKDSSQIGPGV